MTAIFYEKHLLISRPLYDELLQAWRPYASVTFDDNGDFLYQQIQTFDGKNFETEDEALSFGFIVARQWVDDSINGRK